MAKKTNSDPTGQRDNRAKASARIIRRLKTAKRDVLDVYTAIPRSRKTTTKVVNAQEVYYQYDISPTQQEQVSTEVHAIIAMALLGGSGRMPSDWWFKSDVELPYRQGALDEVVQLNRMGVGQIDDNGIPVQAITPDELLFSTGYSDGLNTEYAAAYEGMRALSDRTADQVVQEAAAGMSAGLVPAALTAAIVSRFNVAESSAKRTGSTEINRAYTNSKLNTDSIYTARTTLRVGVLHISALSTTTRTTHAARHGLAYSVLDQERWWSEGGNRYNCLCTTKPVFIAPAGQVVQKSEQKKIRSEGKEFFS